jgi:uncharacterized metal-binding protein YceD (DUF177 family)
LSNFAADFFASYNTEMKNLEEYIIPLNGSEEGVSEHTFKLGKQFFEYFEDSDILDSDVTVLMKLTKGIRLFEMNFHLSGDLTVNCDRCLEPMVQEIDFDAELFIKYGEKYEEVDDKVVTIAPNDDQINIASFMFEYAKLSLPMQCTHFEGECNNEMLDQMEKYERKEDKETKTDSRWDALAGLKDKLE